MRHLPLRTIHPVPHPRNREVEIGAKYVWKLYRLIKSITIKCPNMPMSLFSRNSIPKPKTCRITLSTLYISGILCCTMYRAAMVKWWTMGLSPSVAYSCRDWVYLRFPIRHTTGFTLKRRIERSNSIIQKVTGVLIELGVIITKE